jgi:hypothetical protein
MDGSYSELSLNKAGSVSSSLSSSSSTKSSTSSTASISATRNQTENTHKGSDSSTPLSPVTESWKHYTPATHGLNLHKEVKGVVKSASKSLLNDNIIIRLKCPSIPESKYRHLVFVLKCTAEAVQLQSENETIVSLDASATTIQDFLRAIETYFPGNPSPESQLLIWSGRILNLPSKRNSSHSNMQTDACDENPLLLKLLSANTKV